MSEPKLTAKQKEAIAHRASGCCEYCRSQARFSPDPFSIEHIIPRSKGGTDENGNLALACQGCNNRKYSGSQMSGLQSDLTPNPLPYKGRGLISKPLSL
jgi:5-methylcytosine-specific restriction endonuclease McrA